MSRWVRRYNIEEAFELSFTDMRFYLTRGTHIILAKCKVATISPASTLPWCAICGTLFFLHDFFDIYWRFVHWRTISLVYIYVRLIPIFFSRFVHSPIAWWCWCESKLDSSDIREQKSVPRDLKKTLFKEQLSCETRLAGC